MPVFSRGRGSALLFTGPPKHPSPSPLATLAAPLTSPPTPDSPPNARCPAQDFAKLQLGELGEAISARRNKIFLMMEEVRRLRIQQRLKVGVARRALMAGVGAWFQSV